MSCFNFSRFTFIDSSSNTSCIYPPFPEVLLYIVLFSVFGPAFSLLLFTGVSASFFFQPLGNDSSSFRTFSCCSGYVSFLLLVVCGAALVIVHGFLMFISPRSYACSGACFFSSYTFLSQWISIWSLKEYLLLLNNFFKSTSNNISYSWMFYKL